MTENRPATMEDFERIRREELAKLTVREDAKAATSTADDRETAAQLMIESGKTEGEAWRTIAAGIPAGMRIAIKQRQERAAAEKQEALDRNFAASPAGRKLAAERAIEAREEQKRLVASGRVLIEEDPRYGIDTAADLTDDEVLQLSGIVQQPVVEENPLSMDERLVRGIPKDADGNPRPRFQSEVRALDHINEGGTE
jgi:hypothetical protein